MHRLLASTSTGQTGLLGLLLGLLGVLSAQGGRASAASGTVWATPHDSYSSSVGVLGCKVDTNRIAYWPAAVDCTNLCVALSYGGRTLHLLRVDQSGGAHDVSYDAWNQLLTGKPATEAPTAGGAIAMAYEDVDAAQCRDLIHTDGHRLPLSAANSMNFLASCLEQEDSWVARNYVLYNILDPVCSWGRDEECSLDWAGGANQPSCPHTLGDPVRLTSDPVYNIQYPTGKKVLASSSGGDDGQTSGAASSAVTGSRNGAVGHPGTGWVVGAVALSHAAFWSLGCRLWR